jgi:hypothetical protein
MLLSKSFEYLSYRICGNKTLFFLIFIMITAHAVPLIADEKKSISTDSIDTVYDLTSNGADIGDISIIRSQQGDPGGRLYLVEESVSAKVSGFWGLWEMTSIGSTVIDDKGLLGFDYKVKENDKNWHIFGDRHDQELWCSVRKVLTKKEKDEEDVAAVSSMVISHTVPYSGEILTVIGMLSDNDDNEGELRISLDSFEIAYWQLPSFLMKKPKGLGKGKVRLLDASELKIETYKFEEMEQELIETAKRTFKCRVYSITNPKGKSRYWLTEDELGAFIVKEYGRDDDGPYEILLKQYNTEIRDSR